MSLMMYLLGHVAATIAYIARDLWGYGAMILIVVLFGVIAMLFSELRGRRWNK